MKPIMKRIRLLAIAAIWFPLAQGQAAEWHRPTGMGATSNGNTILLTWTPATRPDAVEQRVLRFEQARRDQPQTRSIVATLPVDAVTYTDTSVEPGKGYTYAVSVRTSSDADARDWAAWPTSVISIGHWPPHRLRGYSKKSIHEELYVYLQWDRGTNPDYVRQKVLRRQGKGNWAEIAELGNRSHEREYRDYDVVLGEKYLYAIRGERANGKGVRSKSIKVTAHTRPRRPSNFRLQYLHHDMAFAFAWTSGFSPGPDGQNEYVRQAILRKKLGSDTWETIYTMSDPETDGVIHNLPNRLFPSDAMPGDQYFYRVKAEKANGRARFSNKVGVVVP